PRPLGVARADHHRVPRARPADRQPTPLAPGAADDSDPHAILQTTARGYATALPWTSTIRRRRRPPPPPRPPPPASAAPRGSRCWRSRGFRSSERATTWRR